MSESGGGAGVMSECNMPTMNQIPENEAMNRFTSHPNPNINQVGGVDMKECNLPTAVK